MLVENILFLQKNYPVLYNEIKKLEDERNNDFISIEETRSNNKTLKIENNGNTMYLHSKYDPIREAELIISNFNKQENIDAESHVIFYGVGLGYHIDVFSRLYPNTTFSIYEPAVDVFIEFLNNKRIDNFASKRIETVHCEYNPEIMDDFFHWITNKTDKRIIIMDLPIYRSAFEEQYNKFLDKFKESIRNKRSTVNTNYAFQERWIMNSVINFKEVLSTPNILMQDDDLFKNKTAILVSAGPSLDFEIENLKKVKEEGLAFIFSVGSAINTLVHNNILPDAICTYDPTYENQLVFNKINRMGIDSIPMIFGSSVGFETLVDYKGPKIHMITSQDTISNYLLKDNDDKSIRTVNDAPSIAIVTLELLNKLEFSTVILVGQNLAFFNNKNYAEGVDYYTEATEEIKNLIMVKNVLGEEVGTSIDYNNMRAQLETYIKAYDDMTIINTTINGAHIEGAEFISMETVLTERLKDRIVIGNELNERIKPNTYELDYLKSKLNIFKNKYIDYKRILLELKNHIEKMNKLLNNRNISQVELMYTKLDSIFKELQANDFFVIISKPMSRVQINILSNEIDQIKTYKDLTKKADRMIKVFQGYSNSLYSMNDKLEEIYNEFIKIITI